MKLWTMIGRLAFWLSWPLVAVYLRFGERTRIVVEAEGKVLVVKGWLSSGKWNLPGGGLHYKEDPTQGVLRELREETGLSLKPGQVTSLGFTRMSSNGLSFRCQCFGVKLSKTQPIGHKGLEIIDVAWIEPSRLNGKTAANDVIELMAVWKQHSNLIK